MRISAANEEGVGIVTLRQENATSGDTVCGKPMGQLFCCLPATLVRIVVESDIDSARPIT